VVRINQGHTERGLGVVLSNTGNGLGVVLSITGCKKSNEGLIFLF